jgi:hypothetical protein
MSRRIRQHALVLVVVVVALAGCGGGGGTATPAGSPTDEGAGDGGTENDETGGPDTADGDATGESSSGVDATATPTLTPTAAPTATATSTPTATQTPTATPTPTSTPGPTLGEALNVTDSFRYRYELDKTSDGDPVGVVQAGRYYEEDYFGNELHKDGDVDLYGVDGEYYVVDDGGCDELPFEVGSPRDPGFWVQQDAMNLSLRPTNTTTVDGERVYVYESETDARTSYGYPGPFTYYVSVETGHLLRQESPSFRMDTYDWGHDEAVETPC